MSRNGVIAASRRYVNTWAVQNPPVMLKPFEAIFLAA